MLSLQRGVLPMVRTLRILQADGQSSDALPPQEAKRILTDAEQRASDLVKAHRDKLDLIAEALLMHEELDREEVEKIMSGVPITDLRKEPPKPAPEAEPPGVVVAPPAPDVPPKPGLAFGGT